LRLYTHTHTHTHYLYRIGGQFGEKAELLNNKSLLIMPKKTLDY